MFKIIKKITQKYPCIHVTGDPVGGMSGRDGTVWVQSERYLSIHCEVIQAEKESIIRATQGELN